jgi:hypothetical protein
MNQYEIEQKFDRKNIRAHILKDISAGLEEPIDLSVKLVTDYLTNKTYYKSKLDRLQKLDASLEGVLKIVTEVCILVLPLSTAQPIQGVAGQLGILLDYEDVLEGVKTAAEILAVMAQSDLFNLIPARSSETGSIMIISNYRLEDSTLDYINQTKYLPPMIELPKIITSNYCSGYLTRTDSVILGSGNHHNGEIGLDVINILNQIPLAIDTNMSGFYEQSKKELNTDEKQRNHNKLVNDSAVVVDDLIDAGNNFWFTHKVDKRGRIYCQGYHVSYQGTSYKKSLINLARKEFIV